MIGFLRKIWQPARSYRCRLFLGVPTGIISGLIGTLMIVHASVFPSANDTESEHAVQTALDELMRGLTTRCITPRLSTILHADVIVVLNQGHIVEAGKHAEFVRHGGSCRKLHDLQFQA
jgi:hypothetical protein